MRSAAVGLLMLIGPVVIAGACGPEAATDSATTSVQAGGPAVVPATTAASAAPAAPAAASSATPVGAAPSGTVPPVNTATPGLPAGMVTTPAAPAAAGGAAASAGAPGVGATPGSTVPSQPTAAGAGTWCGVKQTLDSKCTVCHNEMKTAGAPMSLKSYADTQAAAVTMPAKKVYELVQLRVHDKMKPMPPQGMLTADELNNIDAWAKAGAPAGADATCAGNAPAATQEDDGWAWPTNCDATYKVLSHGNGGENTPYVVPAGGETHPNITVNAPWGNEELQMIAWRAVTDNPKVLHHWILYGPSGEHIVGWSPGKEHNAAMPDDVGMHLPNGQLRMNMHYNNVMGTTEGKDNSGLEICALKKSNFRPKTAATATSLTQFLINIPPKAMDMAVTGSCTVNATEPVTIISASPHAHKLAHHMKFTVTHAGGGTEVMHDADFNFEEQTAYPLKTPVIVKSGDTITTTCVFSNPGNTAVTFGENTENEMCFNFAVYYPMNALNCGAGLPAGGIPGF